MTRLALLLVVVLALVGGCDSEAVSPEQMYRCVAACQVGGGTNSIKVRAWVGLMCHCEAADITLPYKGPTP